LTAGRNDSVTTATRTVGTVPGPGSPTADDDVSPDPTPHQHCGQAGRSAGERNPTLGDRPAPIVTDRAHEGRDAGKNGVFPRRKRACRSHNVGMLRMTAMVERTGS
jgi:hypothetical protein